MEINRTDNTYITCRERGGFYFYNRNHSLFLRNFLRWGHDKTKTITLSTCSHRNRHDVFCGSVDRNSNERHISNVDQPVSINDCTSSMGDNDLPADDLDHRAIINLFNTKFQPYKSLFTFKPAFFSRNHCWLLFSDFLHFITWSAFTRGIEGIATKPMPRERIKIGIKKRKIWFQVKFEVKIPPYVGPIAGAIAVGSFFTNEQKKPIIHWYN